MAEIVSSSDKFSRLLERRKSLFYDDVALPNYVFKMDYQMFRVAHSSSALESEFYDLMLEFSENLDINGFVFMMVAPDPSEYYYSHFGKYGVITFDCNDTGKDIKHLLVEAPPESPADAMTDIVSQFALFPIVPKIPDWCVWVDRDCEVAVVALKDRNRVGQFIELYGKWAKQIREIQMDTMTAEPVEAVNSFMEYGFKDFVVPDWFKNPFLKNYERN